MTAKTAVRDTRNHIKKKKGGFSEGIQYKYYSKLDQTIKVEGNNDMVIPSYNQKIFWGLYK